MKVTINIEKRYAYVIIGLLVFGIGIIGVNAVERASSGGGTHDYFEMGIPDNCDNGGVLKWDGDSWECGTDTGVDGNDYCTISGNKITCPIGSLTDTNADTICSGTNVLNGNGDCVTNNDRYSANTDYCSGGVCSGDLSITGNLYIAGQTNVGIECGQTGGYLAWGLMARCLDDDSKKTMCTCMQEGTNVYRWRAII